MQPRLRLALLPALISGLAACVGTQSGPGPVPVPPAVRPAPPVPPVAAPSPAVTPPSAATVAARGYYARIEANYLAQGLLRTDGGGSDTPFGARDLTENFLSIAFWDEYSESGGALQAKRRERTLHRWTGPVTLSVEFGASVPERDRRHDRTVVAGFAARLSRLTGLPIHLTAGPASHTVLFLNSDERQAAAPRLRALAPGISQAALRSVTAMPAETYCTVFSFTRGKSPVYSQAITVIRADMPDLLRTLCVHEELAQSLGLQNDDPAARPSIFNDNEEFALLTRQDELMLRILYDPRLSPGMTLAEARPVVAAIATELLGGDS